MLFQQFARLINAQFTKMQNSGTLVRSNATKDEMWEAYLAAFPAGTNPIFRERTEHDCSCCRHAIRDLGNAIWIKDDLTLETVWDVAAEGMYKPVAEALSALVKRRGIANMYITDQSSIGTRKNRERTDAGDTFDWYHFYGTVQNPVAQGTVGTATGKATALTGVTARRLEEISLDALETVQILIEDNNLLRGPEFLSKVKSFALAKRRYEALTQEQKAIFPYTQRAFRDGNSVIMTLLQDLSAGEELTVAVGKFENKVNGANYKRPKALVSRKQIEQGLARIQELGIGDSLARRHAVSTDVSARDIIFSGTRTQLADSAPDPLRALLGKELRQELSPKSIERATPIGIEEFIENVVPTIDNMSVYMTKDLNANKVSISAPENADAPSILGWGTNFAWAYESGTADAIKQNVKAAGGDIVGFMRFSIQWNEDRNDKYVDMDAHCRTPVSHIYFSTKLCRTTKGTLDVDIMTPDSKTAVENIVWKRREDLVDGDYRMYVHQYSGNLRGGLRAQIELDGVLYNYDLSNTETEVATITVKNGKVAIKHHAKATTSTSGELVPVTMMMLSPNHWGDAAVGNKHYMFMLEDFAPEDSFRGYFNEFLAPQFVPERRVLDLLASKMSVDPVENGLSGLGFSSTIRKKIVVQTTQGSKTSLYSVQF